MAMKRDEYTKMLKRLHAEDEASFLNRLQHRIINWIATLPPKVRYFIYDAVRWVEYGTLSPLGIAGRIYYRLCYKLTGRTRILFCWNHFTINLEGAIHKDELVISDCDRGFGMCRGVRDDWDDAYYIIDYPKTGRHYLSAVTGFIPLKARVKGRFEEYFYESLEQQWQEEWNDPVNKAARKVYFKNLRAQYKKIFGKKRKKKG